MGWDLTLRPTIQTKRSIEQHNRRIHSIFKNPLLLRFFSQGLNHSCASILGCFGDDGECFVDVGGEIYFFVAFWNGLGEACCGKGEEEDGG